ncbi:hypothetical protein H4W81_005064 [Nonomuraea africana]|uniref:Uncharacterized protein n=1 Tax=Nonomuraea africana TaxID=46171 RepID=A0ABR9KJY9_9ACTN|nr:hypothetical protein [Nonomuraea africana]
MAFAVVHGVLDEGTAFAVVRGFAVVIGVTGQVEPGNCML